MEVKQAAVNLLARREHSRAELIKKLLLKGFSETDIGSVIEQLNQAGLQSDERFAEAYVRYRAGSGYGPIRIALELRERGVSELLIEQFVDHNDPDWVDRAKSVHIKKFKGGMPQDFNERAKHMRFLQYRGFSHEQITHVMSE